MARWPSLFHVLLSYLISLYMVFFMFKNSLWLSYLILLYRVFFVCYLLIFFFVKVTRNSKHILPHLARFCLVSTFFEDGVRMWVQWSEQREYMDISWGCGWFLATMFVVINLIGQLGAVAMVLTRYKVDIACGMLFFIVVLQVRTISKILSLFCFLFFL